MNPLSRLYISYICGTPQKMDVLLRNIVNQNTFLQVEAQLGFYRVAALAYNL